MSINILVLKNKNYKIINNIYNNKILK